MKISTFSDFFRAATGYEPFPYQLELAQRDHFPSIMNIPTGAGKTAAVILSWLWCRSFHATEQVKSQTPRRLIYCLPMRTLVEQTKASADGYLARLRTKYPELPPVSVHVMMGGETDNSWMLNVQHEQLIVGTQDMLISAAVNRGYGMSRFRWPMGFGLLNNDCLWVLDEVQLMGPSLVTSVQLQVFREQLGTFGPSQSVWMSATQSGQWFDTVDSQEHARPVLRLSERDKNSSRLAERLSAKKILRRASQDYQGDERAALKRLAAEIAERHRPGTLTLVVLNRVERAQSLFKELKATTNEPDLLLVHSRFRPTERSALSSAMSAPVEEFGRIIISTQVVEAGVDISAATMFTDLAPWTSMVQRFGRCNRYGEHERGEIYWIDCDQPEPYSDEELSVSRESLIRLEGASVGPSNLPKTEYGSDYFHVLRKRDLIDLFDTSPDLSGNDIDVSRFIRAGGDLDVAVYWREWDGERPPETLGAPAPDELCPVPLWSIKTTLKKLPAWCWDHLEGRWWKVSERRVRPGMKLVIKASDGAYDAVLGWTAKAKSIVPVIVTGSGESEDDISSDPLASARRWQTLAEHSDEVVRELNTLLCDIDLSPELERVLRISCRWHDAGKAHEVFRKTMAASSSPPDPDETWAKSPSRRVRHSQPHFRHELAGALASLEHPELWSDMTPESRDLVAYLIASHHGKVRLSIRSFPGETVPERGTRIARGVMEGSEVMAANLGDGHYVPHTKLDLSLMEIGLAENGRPSWLERALGTRDRIGVFRLAFLEALVRIADMRASGAAGGEKK